MTTFRFFLTRYQRSKKRNKKQRTSHIFSKLTAIGWYFLSFCVLNANINAKPVWSVYIFMDARERLEKPAFHSCASLLDELCRLQKARVEKIPLRLCIELFSENESIRFMFDEGVLEQSAHSATKNAVSCLRSALREGCLATFSKPAHNTLLILSGHGSGILEPAWNDSRQRWQVPDDQGESAITRYLLTKKQALYEKVFDEWDYKSLFFIPESKCENSVQSSFYGNNPPYCTLSDLQAILQTISSVCLQGKPLDVLGFDACYMSMLEIAALFSPHARYMVASPGKEPLHGWDYRGLARILVDQCCAEHSTETNALFALCLSRSLIVNYQAHQRQLNKYGSSLCAFDLRLSDQILSVLQKLATALTAALQSENCLLIKNALREARLRCAHQFSSSAYCDLHAFFTYALEGLSSLHEDEHIFQLKTTMIDGLSLLEEMIIANSSTNRFQERDCSIYFPLNSLSDSYATTLRKYNFELFTPLVSAEKPSWYSFLKELHQVD